MARYKEFDEDKVLDKAMHLFWRKGYEATSVQDLVDHLGIGRGSLYGTFGGKHDLYLAALDRYQAGAAGEAFEPFEACDSAKGAIAQVFRSLIDEAATDADRCGCFIVNSAVELAPHDQDIAARAKEAVAGMEDKFFEVLTQGVEKGELSPDRDWRSVARLLVNSVLGLRVMAKINPDRQILKDMVSATLSILD